MRAGDILQGGDNMLGCERLGCETYGLMFYNYYFLSLVQVQDTNISFW